MSDDVEAFIRKHGVTKCPTAILAPTTTTIAAADAEATAHQRGLFKKQPRKAPYKYFYGDRSKTRNKPYPPIVSGRPLGHGRER